MTLSDKEREEYFPVHIDLGAKAPEGIPMPGGKKGRKHYPMVYLDSVPGLEQLPKEGCILVGFRRKRISIEEGENGAESAGVSLELRHFCLPEDYPEEARGDLADAFRAPSAAGEDKESGDETYDEDED